MRLPVASHDLPASYYPFTIQAYHPETQRIVWERYVEMPPPGQKMVLHIPPLRKLYGHPVGIRVLFANGEVKECGPLYDQ